MRAIDVRHKGNEKVICAWHVDGVIVDPGPQSTEDTLLEALGGRGPARDPPHAHPLRPRGRHRLAAAPLARRARLRARASARRTWRRPSGSWPAPARLYGGEEGLRDLWGEVVPVPEAEPARAVAGGETVLDAFRVEYTPGHARHHVAYLHEPSGMAFVGDVAGVRIPPADLVLAPDAAARRRRGGLGPLARPRRRLGARRPWR